MCEVEKVKLTYSHTRLGLVPQIWRPLLRIVVTLVYFFKIQLESKAAEC
jgi:hypothetical protein